MCACVHTLDSPPGVVLSAILIPLTHAHTHYNIKKQAGDAADEDSNAEEFHANDYPDTPSESSSIEDGFFSDEDDEGLGGLGFRMQRPRRGEYGDSSSGSEEEEEGEELGRRQQGGLGLFGRRRRAGVGRVLAGIGEEDEEEGVAMGVDAAMRRCVVLLNGGRDVCG